jgi:hypothetical protein
MTIPACPASAFLSAPGPAPVPFQLCCVLALVAAAGSSPESFVCGAPAADPLGTLLWPDPGPDIPTIGEPAR